MTFLKKLRDAAMQCSNPEYRRLLREAADHVEGGIREVVECPTDETMSYLQGQWAAAKRLLLAVPPEADPTPPTAGAIELRKAA